MNAERLAVQISLIGPWVETDIDDPLPGEQYAPLREALKSAGLWATAADLPGTVLLSAAMLESPADEADVENPPLIASVIMSEHVADKPLSVATVDGNEIVPIRHSTRRTFAWPSADVGDVTLADVSYLVPSPDGDKYYTVTFSTPNIPLIAEMEYLFDSIMATMVWVAAAK